MSRGRGDVEIVLRGIDGSNPLAFMAAIGTLRAMTLAVPDANVRIGWRAEAGAWRSVVTATNPLDADLLLDCVLDQLGTMRNHPALATWDNLGVPPESFRPFALDAAGAATRQNRTWADYVAAFACDTIISRENTKDPIVEDTAFRTMSGAGHQDFLGFMRNIIVTTKREHVRKALFDEWQFDDPVTNSTLRWDPADDVRHALRWRNPSGDATRTIRGTMLGANRLAIEALPMFPAVPVGSRLETTAFRGSGRRGTFFTWPIWAGSISMDVCRSVLALDELSDDNVGATLQERGILAVFRSQRITEGKYRNFTPARAIL